MGVRSNTLGGIHMHKLFPFTTDNNACTSPFCCAEYALQKIKINTRLQHALLTLDVLFFDELAQISAQQVSEIYIIIRHADNGRFYEKPFWSEIEDSNQAITFCGVGSHHKNAIVEIKNQTLTLGDT